MGGRFRPALPSPPPPWSLQLYRRTYKRMDDGQVAPTWLRRRPLDLISSRLRDSYPLRPLAQCSDITRVHRAHIMPTYVVAVGSPEWRLSRAAAHLGAVGLCGASVVTRTANMSTYDAVRRVWRSGMSEALPPVVSPDQFLRQAICKGRKVKQCLHVASSALYRSKFHKLSRVVESSMAHLRVVVDRVYSAESAEPALVLEDVRTVH